MKKILEPKNLPYAGAIAQSILFAFAGNKFFQSFGWLVGLGIGAVVNYSIALAASRINDIAKNRKPLAWLALVILLLLSPTTITLSFFYPEKIYTAIAWAVCVDLSITLAGAVAGKSLIPQSESQKPAERTLSGKSGRKAVRSKPLSKIPCRYTGAGCELSGTQNAMNAHAPHCKFKPIEIDKSLLIDQTEDK